MNSRRLREEIALSEFHTRYRGVPKSDMGTVTDKKACIHHPQQLPSSPGADLVHCRSPCSHDNDWNLVRSSRPDIRSHIWGPPREGKEKETNADRHCEVKRFPWSCTDGGYRWRCWVVLKAISIDVGVDGKLDFAPTL